MTPQRGRAVIPLYLITVGLLTAGAILLSTRFDMSLEFESGTNGASTDFQRYGSGDAAVLLAAALLASGAVCLTALVAGARRPMVTRTTTALAILVAVFTIWGLRYTVDIGGDRRTSIEFEAWLVLHHGDVIGSVLRGGAVAAFTAGAIALGIKSVGEHRAGSTAVSGAAGAAAAD